MAEKKLQAMYREIHEEFFPETMELSFFDGKKRQTLVYEKVTWNIGGELKGLRYGENPDQEAALYKLTNGNLVFGEVTSIRPGRYLASEVELLQSGKHPGKINITDTDSALNILRYFQDTPCAVIIKHNNPCGVAKGRTIEEAYEKAYLADRIAAFGGVIAVNREVSHSLAERIAESYSEVVVAPEYGEGALSVFEKKPNMRIMRIGNIRHLSDWVGERFIDLSSLIDGGIVVQWSFVPQARSREDLIPAYAEHKGVTYRINRLPTDAEYDDLLFGWLIESGVTSNSVLYVKDGVTVGIGTGEQDRVGVAEIARDKAYRKMQDRISFLRYAIPFAELKDTEKRREIEAETADAHGGLTGSAMVSDAFFPFRDGIDVGLREGVSAVIQPGGSLRDFESIEACNERNATMVFTGQRSFKH